MSPRPPPARRPGLIGLFARHPTAGNLLMILMLLAGAVGLANLNRQFFPDFAIDIVVVTVPWPGAAAEDVEANIVRAIEPEVRFLDGVDRVIGVAAEGLGTVVIEYEQGADMQKALAEVEQAIARITTFPAEAEEPRVQRAARYDRIARLVLSGPVPEQTLKEYAKRIRDRLLAAGIDRVRLFGVRDERLYVELEPERLLQLETRLGELAERIRARSLDLPAGDVAGEVERAPRVLGRAYDARELAEVELGTSEDGRRLRLGEVARVREGFVEDQPEGRRQGLRAVELLVQRALSADALEVQERLDRVLAEVRADLPPTLTLERYEVFADLIRGRINLLLKNGLTGFLLVLLVLFLFLNARVAFWVAIGIPVSLAAMLGTLWMLGHSINMVSLFAMILGIGIVVDDAIVVGEHAVSLREQGLSPQLAAEEGARRMFAPVLSATLTTIAAFLPLMVIGGIMGVVIREIPVVVTAMLVASLIECLLVLPTHLRGALGARELARGFRQRFDALFQRLREGMFRRLVVAAVRQRYTTLAAAVAVLLLTFGLILGGHVGFVFFKGPESDYLVATLRMAPGTPRARTEAALVEVERALYRAIESLGGRPEELVVMVFGRLASQPAERPDEEIGGDHVGGFRVELSPSDSRAIRTEALIQAWSAAIPPIPGLEEVTILEMSGGPPGREVDIRLKGGLEVESLKQASEEVRAALAALPGVSQISDDLPYGKPELVIRLSERGRSLGFTTAEVARQLRDAFAGRTALRFARGDEEVEVVVRLAPESVRDLPLESFRLLLPDGREVALGEVARIEESQGFARIRREDGEREVAITAELDESVIRLEQVQEALAPLLRDLEARFGVEAIYAGRAEEQAETLRDMRLGALIGLGLIYVVLAWVFRSFTRPLVVMVVIPFGLIGATLGHLVMGYDLTILSLIALLGLSGVLVNDSIILVSTIDQRMAAGGDPMQSIIDGTVSRFRAVLLTSLTTIGGLTPLMFETSFQAQFLIPMAITLSFGLAVNTLLVLLIVPALVAIQTDLRRGGWRRREADVARLEAA